MSVALRLSALALRGIVEGACSQVGAERGGAAVAAFLTARFVDQSQNLHKALLSSVGQSWKALEIALAADSLWNRCKALLVGAEDRAFAQQVRAFLDIAPLPEPPGRPDFRNACLNELRAARKAGLLTGGKLEPHELAFEAAHFASFADPQEQFKAEWRNVVGIINELNRGGHQSLAWLVSQRPQQGMPLLVLAVRYFFRRAVEEDRKLFQGLAFARLEELGEAQEKGFAALAGALAQRGDRLEELLGDVKAVVVQTHEAVLDLQARMQGQSDRIQDLSQAMLQFLGRHELQQRELRPSDGLSIRNDEERQLVKQLIDRYRALPDSDRQQMPALLNAVGKLEVVAGNFAAAHQDFQRVAGMVSESSAQAEARFNAYRAALERRDWDAAMHDFIAAVRLDAKRFAPFPVGKYVPQRVLGAGGFGVAFLCKHKHMNDLIVVKAITQEELNQDADKVFSEAQLLRQLDHPAIIRISDCGFVETRNKARPFLVMDYFESQTLEEYVERNGPLPLPDCLAIMRQVAEGLQAAHGKGILHRDIKPANLLVRKDGPTWKVKLIDFGLALKQDVLTRTIHSSRHGRSIIGTSIAGTLDYSPPEQLGRRTEAVGPYSDLYSFAVTCGYALFKTTKPLFEHWRGIPAPLAELLNECLNEDPRRRPASFTAVLPRLADESVFPRAQSGRTVPARPEEVPEARLAQPPARKPVHSEEVPEARLAQPPAPARKAAPPPQPVRATEAVHRRQPDHLPRSEGLAESRKQRAREIVRTPAIALMVVSVLGTLLGLLGASVMGFDVSSSTSSTPPSTPPTTKDVGKKDMGKKDGGKPYYSSSKSESSSAPRAPLSTFDRVGGSIFYGTFALASLLGLLAGWRMMNLKNYWLALLGSGTIMYGGCGCLFLGVVVGLWSLTTLMRAEVREGFRSEA